MLWFSTNCHSTGYRSENVGDEEMLVHFARNSCEVLVG